MTPARRVGFVDSSAYFALADPRDGAHEAAQRGQARLVAEHWRLVTTNFVVAETHALIVSRLDHRLALRFLDRIDRSPTAIVRATEDDESRARAILRRYEDKDFSLTDAISFAVMERLGIRDAFAFDQHFAQYGFAPLTPPA